jgi:serine/threonine protein kinase
MGEVYRGRDTKLDREVAIKVLPTAMARDHERLARFDREAKVLASLNHPNIAQIYGLEESGEMRALVMELVAGSTLSIPQPTETALRYAQQIAEALEAAHEKGITHRDLKPANIMITPEGIVKVLDFGLATVPGRESGSDPANSPTLTLAATQAGMLMGTAAYMSPEQASGKVVDKRSDIWSFGVVLWEMFTGSRLFDGETISHTLADVLRAPIDFAILPASLPVSIVELVKRCLDRNPKTRLQAIGEARITIQRCIADPKREAEVAPPVPPRFINPPWALWAVVAGLAIGVAALAYVAFRHTQEPLPRAIKASILSPDGSAFVSTSGPAISPDGLKLAFAAIRDGRTLLWIRDLDSLAARSITGTDGASNPFWSPDSQSIGFFADCKLKRIDVAGGTVLTLCTTEGNLHGASWSSRGVILFPISPNGALYRIEASGGTHVPVTTLDRDAGEVSHRLPWFLPDGRHFLFSVRNQEQFAKSAIYVGDLDSKERTLVFKGEGHAVYVPAGGFLIVATGGITDGPLMAQAMDASNFRTTGNSFPIAESVDLSSGVWAQHQFSVSRDGVLVYGSTGANAAQLTWFDRAGKRLGTVGPRDSGLRMGAISPDGSTVAADSFQSGNRDIWLHNLARGASSRFTFNSANGGANSPAWSPDGKHLIYASFEDSRPARVVRKALNGEGAAEPVGSTWGDPPRVVSFVSWSADGRYVVARLSPAGPTGGDIWMMPMNGAGEKPRPYLQTDANEGAPNLSPSSDWLAYTSDETRRVEVYVQSFPNPGRKYQVSVNGGITPVWSRDGKELYFTAPDRQMMAVPISKIGGNLEIGAPKVLFDSKIGAFTNVSFDVSRDGRFLIPVQEQASASPLTLVVNWQAALKK